MGSTVSKRRTPLSRTSQSPDHRTETDFPAKSDVPDNRQSERSRHGRDFGCIQPLLKFDGLGK